MASRPRRTAVGMATVPHTRQITEGAGRGGDTDSLLIAQSPVVLLGNQPLSSAATLNIE
jgi:hypothetical protein